MEAVGKTPLGLMLLLSIDIIPVIDIIHTWLMRYKITTLKYKAGWKCDPVGLYLYYLQQSAGQGFATRNTGERKTFAQLTK